MDARVGYRFEDFQLEGRERERERSIVRDIFGVGEGGNFNEFLNGGWVDGLYSPYVLLFFFLGIMGA